MTTGINLLTSALASGLRAGAGIAARPGATKPLAVLKLYDMENCPYCRIAREALTELDLDAEIYPCPKGGTRFRGEVQARGGKAQFPYLIDPNTGAAMYESMDIVAYLHKTYGAGGLPLRWRLGPLHFGLLHKVSSSLASAARLNQGMRATPCQPPAEMLELYSFEGSPFARPVRELLCEMEIPYILRNCGRTNPGEWLPPKLRERLNIRPDSRLPNRVAMQRREGKMGIPYLWDPNTKEGLFESDKIVAHLKARYGG